MRFLLEFDHHHRFHRNQYNMYSLHNERSEFSSNVSEVHLFLNLIFTTPNLILSIHSIFCKNTILN